MDVLSNRDFVEFYPRLRIKYNSASAPTGPTLIGILFARPEADIADKELLPSILYFDARSDSYVTFFFAGYQKRENLDWISADGNEGGWFQERATFRRVSPKLDWFFSPEDFNWIRKELEKNSRWRYSGGVELLLLNIWPDALPAEEDCFTLDFSTTITLKLDTIKDSKVVVGIGALFEKIFQYCENPNKEDPAWGLSDYLGLRVAGRSLRTVLLSLLPKDSGKELDKIANFAVNDLRS